MIAGEELKAWVLDHFDMRELFDALSIGILVLDGQLCPVYANPRAESLLDLRLDELRGRPLQDVLHEPQHLARTLRRVIDDGRGASAADLADASPRLFVSDSGIGIRVAPLRNQMTGTHVLLELL